MKVNNKNLYVKDTGKTGLGVFSKKIFNPGEKVCDLAGEIVTWDDIPWDDENLPWQGDKGDVLQIGKTDYLYILDGLLKYLNHSCDPNTGIKITNKQVHLLAIKLIKPEDEITFDYSITMDENYWEMDCLCGSIKCRKKIRDFKYLPKDIQDYYLKLRVIPDYIC